MYINERVDVNQDGPSLIIEGQPPNNQIGYVFTDEKIMIHCFSLYLYLHCHEVFVTL